MSHKPSPKWYLPQAFYTSIKLTVQFIKTSFIPLTRESSSNNNLPTDVFLQLQHWLHRPIPIQLSSNFLRFDRQSFPLSDRFFFKCSALHPTYPLPTPQIHVRIAQMQSDYSKVPNSGSYINLITSHPLSSTLFGQCNPHHYPTVRLIDRRYLQLLLCFRIPTFPFPCLQHP